MIAFSRRLSVLAAAMSTRHTRGFEPSRLFRRRSAFGRFLKTLNSIDYVGTV